MYVDDDNDIDVDNDADDELIFGFSMIEVVARSC